MTFRNSKIVAVFLLILGCAHHANAQEKNVMAQFSVLPGLSTNGDSAVKITNNLSFNLFGGYNGGVQGFELGTFANIISGEVSGMQISGITNITKGKTSALQVAGILNLNDSTFQGIQIGGLVNVVKRDFQGMQIAGLYNQTPVVYGAQISGITSVTNKIYGLQVSGLAGNVKTIHGLQIAGIFNNAEVVKGTQIAGIANITKSLSGAQIGFINVADSVKGGVPIGFISFVKTGGYRKIDLQFNELFPANVFLKTGVDAFYNIFTAGSNFDRSNMLWSVGYGLGSRFHIAPKALIEFELMASHLSKDQFTDKVNELGRFNMNFAVQLGPLVELYFGPSLNVYVTQVYNVDTQTWGHDIAPKPFYEELIFDFDKPTYIQAWIGGQVGIRL